MWHLSKMNIRQQFCPIFSQSENICYKLTNRVLVTRPWSLDDKSFAMMTLHADIQYIPRNMHTVTALLCFVVVIHWLIFPYPSGLLHWHCGNLTIAPVPAKQPWWIWINTSCEFIMSDCVTTTKQSTTKPCAYFLGYTVCYKLTNRVLVTRPWSLDDKSFAMMTLHADIESGEEAEM